MPAVKNFGYLWDRNRVFWGYPHVEGTYWATTATMEKSLFVNKRAFTFFTLKI